MHVRIRVLSSIVIKLLLNQFSAHSHVHPLNSKQPRFRLSLMDKTFFAGLADGREGAIVRGQAADGFSNTDEHSLGFFESIMHAQNNEDLNAIMAQLEAPVPQPKLVANASSSMPNQDKAAKKREADKAYRGRLKKQKTEMEGNMKALTQENEALKDEVRALQAENTRLDQAFQSRGQEMDKLKHNLNLVMDEHNKQVVLVNGLSEKLVNLSLRDEEIQKLENEIDLLREGKVMDSLCLQLMNENAKLKLQLDAVCDKLLAENPSP